MKGISTAKGLIIVVTAFVIAVMSIVRTYSAEPRNYQEQVAQDIKHLAAADAQSDISIYTAIRSADKAQETIEEVRR